MHTFNSFANLAYSQDGALRAAAADIAGLILESTNHEQAMTDLFNEFRGPYVSAKTSNAKSVMAAWSRSWNASKSAVSYHLKQAGYSAEWPNLRSGNGDPRLIVNEQAAQERKDERAAQQEKDQRDAAKHEQDKRQQQLDDIRALSLEELADQIDTLIAMSTHEPGDVLRELVNRHAAGYRLQRKPAARTKKIA